MPRKKNLSGSYNDEKVTIIGNTPTKVKPRMRDLTINPEEDDIQEAIQKREKREHRRMLIDNEYNKQFSMFRTKGTTIAWVLLSTVFFIGMVYFLNTLFHSPPTQL